MRFGGNSRLSGRDDETGVLGGRNYRGGSLEVRQSVTAGEQRNPALLHTLTDGILRLCDLSVDTVASSGRPGAERRGWLDRDRESRRCFSFSF